MRLRYKLAAVTAGTVVAFTGTSIAHAYTWFALCNIQSTKLCMSADGNNGDKVYGKTYSHGANQEAASLTAVPSPCPTRTSKVQDGADGDDNCGGPSLWWPATNHNFDIAWGDGGIVVELGNHAQLISCFDAQVVDGAVIQDVNCSAVGHLWVQQSVPGGNGSVFYKAVYASDQNNGVEVIGCANSMNNPMLATDQEGSDCGVTNSNTYEWRSVP